MLDNDELPNYGRITGTLHLNPRARQTQAGVGVTLGLAPEKRLPTPSTQVSPPVASRDEATEVTPEVVKVVDRLQDELADAKTIGERAKKSS